MTVEEAAKRLGKTAAWVRIALQQNRVPFGTAAKMPGGEWSYDIREGAVELYERYGLFGSMAVLKDFDPIREERKQDGEQERD